LAKKMDLIMKVQGLIDKSLPGNLKKLANEVKNLRAERQKMEKAQKTLKAQKELNKEITANVAKYRKLRNELKALDEIKKRNVNLTEAEKKKYESLTKKAKALETTIKSQSKSFQKYGMELKKLKIPFDNLQNEIDQTIRKEKELIAQQKIVAKSQGFLKGAKDKVKTGIKVAAVATVGAAIGIGTSSAKEYLEFDKQMIKVKALTGATTQEYEALKKKAMEVGKTTIFTSEEAAAGMEKFALAGFKPKEIISAIPPIFDLATASGEDFIMISDMISDNMTAFNIGINDVGHASDILANTMSRSNTNIQMLGEAFKYVSSSANNLNIDLSTTSAAIGLMGDQAIKSGQAGRDLKQAFSKIADAGVQKKLQKLGVNVKDAKGEFIGLVDFVRQLEKVTKMSGIDKQAFLKDLFGDQGSLAMNKLLTATKEVNGVMYEGADALAEFAKENENATGKAKEMAQTILDSDSGKWALVQSAISDVKLKIGKAIFSSGGTQLMDTVMSWLNELSNVLDGNLNEAVGIIQSVNTADYTASVKFPEYNNQILDGLQILSPITFGNKITSIPKVNTPVFCIFLGDKTEKGYIIGSYFSDENVSNSQEDEYKIDFQGSSLTIKEDGNIELKGTLTKIDSEVIITGDTTIEKNMIVTQNVTISGGMSAKKGFETEKATLKNGKLDVQSIDYKEMSKKWMY